MNIMESKKIYFEEIEYFDKDIAMLSSYTSMPKNIDWPKNPEGKILQCIAHIPTNIINEILNTKLEQNHAISIFTYYDKQEYFLDKIVYAGDENELKTVRDNNKIIIHEIGEDIYSLNDVIIPFNKMIISDEIAKNNFYGSKIGGMPVLLQNKNLQINDYKFILQLYGADFPEDINDIFFLSDSLGYLFIKNEKLFSGLFFTQAG
jgi:hypothetical protein